jgi:hypothetical protein
MDEFLLDEICVLRTTPVASVPPFRAARVPDPDWLPGSPAPPPPAQRSVVSCGARHRCARSLVILSLSSRAGARLSRWRGFGGEGERAWDENRFALLYVQLHLLLPYLGFASHGHILLPLQ